MTYLGNKIMQATAPLETSLSELADTVGVDEAGHLVRVDDRIQLAMGQGYPELEPGQEWPMSCRSNYFAIQLLKAQLAPLLEFVANADPTVGLRLRVAEAELASLETQQAADELALTSLRAYAEQTRQLALSTAASLAAQALDSQAQATRLTAVEQKQAADALDLAALKLAQAATEAKASVALSGVEADRLLATAADAKASQALLDAAAAKSLAQAAQGKADADATAAAEAKALALAAQAKAEAAQASATTAINNAATAQATATAVGARLRTKRIATPALAAGVLVTQTITWDTAFADANYDAIPTLEGAGLLSQMATVTARTAATCTVQIKTALAVALAAGAGTLTVTAVHD